MQWTRSEAIALAQQSCTFCYGIGLRPGRGGRSTPCNCVFRAIFRVCYERFRHCAEKEKFIGRSAIERSGNCHASTTWGMKDEEYVADFCLVSKRLLTEQEHRVFRYHYLLGAAWNLCCQKLKMERGAFFHEIYRIEQKLGRGFREVEPYPLFPVDQYFHGMRTDQVSQHPLFAIDESGPDSGHVAAAIAARRKRSKASQFPLKVAAAGSSGD